jgi:hypothetical protein
MIAKKSNLFDVQMIECANVRMKECANVQMN